MKVAVQSLLDKSEADLQALARSTSAGDLSEILDRIWTSIRESNLVSGQAVEKSTTRAVTFARVAMALAGSHREMEIEAWRMMAYALNANEQWPESINYYEKVVPALEELGKRELAARTRIGWVSALQMVGRYMEALEVALIADEWFKGNKDLAGHARLCTNIGGVYDRLNKDQSSIQYYQEAAKIFKDTGDEKALAQVHLNLANTYYHLDLFEESDRNYVRSMRLSQKLGLSDLLSQAHYNRAYLHFLRGRYSDALRDFAKCRAEYLERGSLRYAALCDLDEAEIYLTLNLSVDAGRLAQRAAQSFETLTMRYEQAKALAWAGVAQTQNSRFDEALDLFRVSREKFEQENNHYWIALLDFYRAEAFFGMRRFWEARSFGTAAKQAFEFLGIPSKAVVTLELLARVALEVGARSEALQHARAALKLAEDFKLPLIQFSVYAINARVAEELRDTNEASRFYELAANEIEARRSHLHHDDFRVTFLGGKQQVYEALVRLAMERAPTPEAVTTAYRWCEQAKSRGLIDLLSHHLPEVKPKRDDSLLRRIRRLHEELNSHYLRSRPETQQPTLSPEAAEIELREHELARSLRELSTRDPEYVSLQRAATTSIDEIQSMLGDDTTLVEYFVDRDEVLAFVISSDSRRVVRHVCPLGHVQYMQESLRFQMDKFALGSQYVQEHFTQLIESTRQHLRTLYGNIVRPLAPLLRTRHLIIVPHGRIHYLPFHAFLDGNEYLIDRHSISYAPSGSVLEYCFNKEDVIGRPPLIMGAPDEATPFVKDELAELGSLFPAARVFAGRRATRRTFFREAAEADFVHVAGHAVFRPDNPMFSSFKLSDGWVTALELYSAACHANLVTLSGCKSGVNEVAGADDLLGLTRGFLYAGARSLLLTLWAVNDRSTATFIKAFYRNWLGGHTKSEALQSAIRAIREEYPHPFHWAPFVLVGKP